MTRGLNSSGRSKEPTAKTNERNVKLVFDELSKVFFHVISVKRNTNFGSVDENIVIRVSSEKWDRTTASERNKSER